jgi:hypothetical protein
MKDNRGTFHKDDSKNAILADIIAERRERKFSEESLKKGRKPFEISHFIYPSRIE